jgi:hypothetical protein
LPPTLVEKVPARLTAELVVDALLLCELDEPAADAETGGAGEDAPLNRVLEDAASGETGGNEDGIADKDIDPPSNWSARMQSGDTIGRCCPNFQSFPKPFFVLQFAPPRVRVARSWALRRRPIRVD